MKRKSFKTILPILILLATNPTKAQFSLVNLISTNVYGSTDTADYLPLIVQSNGNVIVAGNKKMNATQYNAEMTEVSNNALTVWNTSFNLSNQKAFVTSSTNDAADNSYFAGAIRTSGTNALDFLVIKKDNTGATQWIATYDNGGNDVATAIIVDDVTGDVFVTGASDGTATCLIDMATMSLNKATGAQQWCTRYNYANAMDIPTAIAIDVDRNELIVSGSSGANLLSYDFVTQKYDMSSGSVKDTERSTNAGGAGQDKLYGMVTDTLGNTYIAGTTYNGSNYDAVVYKLDTALTTVWTKTLDRNGFDDEFIGIDLDDSLNVIVSGVSYRSATEHDAVVLKYRNNGNFAWIYGMNHEIGKNTEALKVVAKSHNEIFVGGSSTTNGNKDVEILRFNRLGRVTLSKSYDGPSNGKDQFMDMEIDGNQIFVSARSYNNSTNLDDNIIIEYAYTDITQIQYTDTLLDVSFVDKEVLIEFNRDNLNMPAINNRDLVYGQLGDFVDDGTCYKIYSLLDPKGEYDFDGYKLPARKVHPNLTEADSISISRMGDDVKVPPFYQTLLVTLPSPINTQLAALKLNAMTPEIYKAQLNYLAEWDWAPNDSLYAVGQTNLHNTTAYDSAHIYCEPAWDYTKGHSFVRVGVYDSGVLGATSPHPDLTNIFHNYNYFAFGSPADDIDNHGTKVAGVIGASSNNHIGVAGIAGGDGSITTGTANTGVSIANMKIGEVSQLAPTSVIRNAFVHGASGNNMPGGKALHIINMSAGIRNLAYDSALVDALNYAISNGVAVVASRGNFGGNNPNSTSLKPNAHNCPATLKPNFVMCVSATGTNGHYHKGSGANTNGTGYSPAYAKGVDFAAPGATTNINSVSLGGGSNPLPSLPSAFTGYYGPFSGTSASAPHVSGIAALMMSYRNSPTPSWDNIVHEDVEALLKRTAKDLALSSYTETVGYDTMTGYGRVRADQAMAALEPQFKIRHIDNNHLAHMWSTGATTITSGTWYWRGESGNSIPAGKYDMDMVEVKWDHSYGPLYGGETYIGAWPLYKASNALGPIPATSTILPHQDKNYVELISASNSTAQVKGYTYHLKNYYSASGTQTVDLWIPYDPASINLAFTLYTNTNVAVSVSKEESEVDYFNLYPNPNTGNFTIGFSSKKDTKASITVMDISGREIMVEEKNVRNGVNRYNVALGDLPKGIYFVTLDIESNKTMVKKVIVN